MLNRIFRFSLLVLTAVGLNASVSATNAWNNYHWARTAHPANLVIVNSTTSEWDPYVPQAVLDWTQADELNLTEEDGSTASRVRRKCNGPTGKIRVCNLAYGYNGWLGIAGISVDSNGHIVKGYTKLNDSYFSSSPYNGGDWMQSVTCQELGHNFGLGHQDEDFYNDPLFSCMDYQESPYAYPDDHDYEMLAAIYAHTDTYSTVADTGGTDGESGGTCNAPPGKGCNKSGLPGNEGDIGWGMSLGRRGHSESFIRIEPDGTRHITYVLWVEDEGEDHHAH